MEAMILLVVIGTAIWVFVDAGELGFGKRVVRGRVDSGPWVWLIGCLLIWIIAFPMYLWTRGHYKRGGHERQDELGQLERLSKLREVGALSEGEFQERKRELLTTSPTADIGPAAPRRGRGALRLMKICGGILLGVIVLGVILQLAGVESPSLGAARSGSQSGVATRSRVLPDRPGLTMAAYQKLRDGISYGEAVAILGASGTEVSRVAIGDIVTVMYSWQAGVLTNMNATFQNDRLISKAQLGLR